MWGCHILICMWTMYCCCWCLYYDLLLKRDPVCRQQSISECCTEMTCFSRTSWNKVPCLSASLLYPVLVKMGTLKWRLREGQCNLRKVLWKVLQWLRDVKWSVVSERYRQAEIENLSTGTMACYLFYNSEVDKRSSKRHIGRYSVWRVPYMLYVPTRREVLSSWSGVAGME